jgi:hypothetical protein
MSPEQAAVVREKERLNLSRKRVLQQLDATDNPRLRRMLEEALADLERKLERLQ